MYICMLLLCNLFCFKPKDNKWEIPKKKPMNYRIGSCGLFHVDLFHFIQLSTFSVQGKTNQSNWRRRRYKKSELSFRNRILPTDRTKTITELNRRINDDDDCKWLQFFIQHSSIILARKKTWFPKNLNVYSIISIIFNQFQNVHCT